MVERIDHFAHMRAEPEPEGEDKDVHFTPDQLEYLSKKFGPDVQLSLVMGGETTETIFERKGQAYGFAAMLAHIATLVKVV